MAMPFSPCDPADGSCDAEASLSILRHIFGPVVDSLVAGADPGAVASANILATMFSFFNSGILIIGSLIVSYVAVMGAVNTANDGEAMGRDWSSLWTPVRIVSGAAVLLPTTSGYSFIQLIVLLFSLWGIGFGNGTYRTGMEMGLLSPDGVVQGVNEPGVYYGFRDYAKGFIATSYCARAANAIYTGQLPGPAQVPRVRGSMIGGADIQYETDGKRFSVFPARDTNGWSNLGGGEPICGTLTLGLYFPGWPATTTDPTQLALQSLRMQVQQAKWDALRQLEAELTTWVNTWPTDITLSGWNRVDSREFNRIVKRWEDQVAISLAARVDSESPGVTSALDGIVTNLTRDGWATAGGWFQKVGMLRGQVVNIMSEPVATAGAPTFAGLPNDPRRTLLANSVVTAVDTVLRKANANATFTGSAPTPQPGDFASVIPQDTDAGIDPTAISSHVDAQMASFVNSTMQSVVDLATGESATGETLCGTAGQMGGSINRMKCIGDYLALSYAGLVLADTAIKTKVTALRVTAGALSSVDAAGFGLDLDAITTPIWDFVIQTISPFIATLVSYIRPLAFYFGVIIPSMPYIIFMVVVLGWILAVLQAMIAAPLWAVMHMTPDRTFIGSQRQGYLLLLSMFARPALAVVGLFAAILLVDPFINFAAKGFFAMRGAVAASSGTVGAVADFVTFAWWLIAFGLLLMPVMYMAFTLPQALPDQVLRWIGAGTGDLGESGASGKVLAGLAATSTGGGLLAASRRGGAGRALPKRLDERGAPGALPPPTDDGGPAPSGSAPGGAPGRGGSRRNAPINANSQGITPIIDDAVNDKQFDAGRTKPVPAGATTGSYAGARYQRSDVLSAGPAGVDATRDLESDGTSIGTSKASGPVNAGAQGVAPSIAATLAAGAATRRTESGGVGVGVVDTRHDPRYSAPPGASNRFTGGANTPVAAQGIGSPLRERERSDAAAAGTSGVGGDPLARPGSAPMRERERSEAEAADSTGGGEGFAGTGSSSILRSGGNPPVGSANDSGPKAGVWKRPQELLKADDAGNPDSTDNSIVNHSRDNPPAERRDDEQ